jgi:hypothetical protein
MHRRLVEPVAFDDPLGADAHTYCRNSRCNVRGVVPN